MSAYSREEAKKRPAQLTEIPPSNWSASHRTAKHPPMRVWESRVFLVQLFHESPFMSVDMRRLTVSRITLQTDGHWHADIPWEALQKVKREVGFGDWYGLELYPRDCDVVNVANMRHLWLLAKPLAIGWFSQ